MNLQEKIIGLSEYKLGFNIYNGYTIISITFPKEWSVIKPDSKDITFAQDEVKTDTYFYSAPITCDMSIIFDSIEATIIFNNEMERKIELFQEKQKELQNLFIEESYETLETLTFSFKKKKEKKNNKKTHIPKEEKVNVVKNTNNVDENIEELSIEEIKGVNKATTKTKPNKISSHKDNLAVLAEEEVCEDVIITESELNNGNY